MELEDYKEKLRKLHTQLRLDQNALIKKFVDENNPYKIGDKVTDHIGSVRFDKLQYTVTGSGNIPTPIYIGIELKKDGTPKKRVVVRNVYGSNVL